MQKLSEGEDGVEDGSFVIEDVNVWNLAVQERKSHGLEDGGVHALMEEKRRSGIGEEGEVERGDGQEDEGEKLVGAQGCESGGESVHDRLT